MKINDVVHNDGRINPLLQKDIDECLIFRVVVHGAILATGPLLCQSILDGNLYIQIGGQAFDQDTIVISQVISPVIIELKFCYQSSVLAKTMLAAISSATSSLVEIVYDRGAIDVGSMVYNCFTKVVVDTTIGNDFPYEKIG